MSIGKYPIWGETSNCSIKCCISNEFPPHTVASPYYNDQNKPPKEWKCHMWITNHYDIALQIKVKNIQAYFYPLFLLVLRLYWSGTISGIEINFTWKEGILHFTERKGSYWVVRWCLLILQAMPIYCSSWQYEVQALKKWKQSDNQCFP